MDKEVFEEKIKRYNKGRKTKRPFVVILKYKNGSFIANDYSLDDDGTLILWYIANNGSSWRVGQTNVKKVKFTYPLMDDEQYEIKGISRW